MGKWALNLIAIAFVVILLVIAYRFFQGDGGRASLSKLEVEINSTATQVVKETNSNEIQSTSIPACRLKEHGIESWDRVDPWIVKSEWNLSSNNNSTILGYCYMHALGYGMEFSTGDPKPEYVLVKAIIEFQYEYTPKRVQYYRFHCDFENRWGPVYKMKPNLNCP